MRVLHCGDAHIGKLIRGRSRLDEQRQVMAKLVETADAENADLVVFPGDLFDITRPDAEQLYVAADALGVLVSRGHRVLYTSGNHDAAGTIRGQYSKIASWMRAMPLDRVHVHDGPAAEVIDGSMFLSLPYPHKRTFDGLVDKSLLERTEVVSRKMEEIIEDLATDHPHDGPRFFVGHLSVLNAQLSADQAMRMGWDVTVREEVFDIFDWTFLGHIHRQQPVGSKGWYSGSPMFTDFGESTQTKGFLVVDTDTGVVTHHDSGAWPMLRISASESTGWDAPTEGTEGFTGWVQVQLDPDEGGEPSFQLKRNIRGLYADAAGVWIDVLPKQAARRVSLPVQATGSTNADILKAYLTAKGESLDPALDIGIAIMNDVDGR